MKSSHDSSKERGPAIFGTDAKLERAVAVMDFKSAKRLC